MLLCVHKKYTRTTNTRNKITLCNGMGFNSLACVFFAHRSYLMTILYLNFRSLFFCMHAIHLKSNIRKRVCVCFFLLLPLQLHGLFSIIYWMILRICLLTWNKLMKIIQVWLHSMPREKKTREYLTLIRWAFLRLHHHHWRKFKCLPMCMVAGFFCRDKNMDRIFFVYCSLVCDHRGMQFFMPCIFCWNISITCNICDNNPMDEILDGVFSIWMFFFSFGWSFFLFWCRFFFDVFFIRSNDLNVSVFGSFCIPIFCYLIN